MSLSDSSNEDDQMLILEAQRAAQPPRKRRRLNDNRSQSQHDDSSSSSDETDSDPKSNSDKENSLNKCNKRVRKPSATQITHSTNRRNNRFSTQPNANNDVYSFGKFKFNQPLNVKPGALVQLELINFLCHSNFSIAFNPMVNIIYGQNGSGKSAIEAGISMALGLNAKKTGRGNNITEVIKFGTDFAQIRLFLNNKGMEALAEYGPLICIERKLTRTSKKNGSSSIRILDGDTLRVKARGMTAVRQICNKLNLFVENPCVVLKQTTAKQLLNSTRGKDKFKFFMDASKLGQYEDAMTEAREQLNEAIYEQKNSKHSFHVIAEKYKLCKRRHDMLVNKQIQEKKVEFWKRAEKWMEYHSEQGVIPSYQKEVEAYELKIDQCSIAKQQKEQEILQKIQKGNALKEQIEEKTSKADAYHEPINVLKHEMTELDRQRKAATHKASANQKYIDKSKRKIRDFTAQYNEALQASQNNERAQQLGALQQNLTEATTAIAALRTERDTISHDIEPTIEMKANEQKLNHYQTAKTYATDELKKFQNQLRSLQQNTDRSNDFLPYQAKRKRISMRQIRQVIQQNLRRFERPPVGPLGEYIQMVPFNDTNDKQVNSKNIQIVQNVLAGSLNSFLVSSTRDQTVFGNIMRQSFGITLSCMQFKHSDKAHEPCANPFEHYRFNDGQESNIVRITDMFTIKDNNAWVYNAILTNSNPERVYAYGDLNQAKGLLSRLSAQQIRNVACLMTYQENSGLYRVNRRGETISATSQRQTAPILESDMSQHKHYYQNQINQKAQEIQEIKQNMDQLRIFVREAQMQLRDVQKKHNKVVRNIQTYERNIEQWSRQKAQLEEDEEDSNELAESMRDFQNSIEDERAQISQLQAVIQPYKDKERELLQQLADKKQELQRILQKLQHSRHDVEDINRKYGKLLDGLRKDKARIDKIPAKVAEFKANLKNTQQRMEVERVRIQEVHEAAQSLGDEVARESYPRNKRDRVFRIQELKQERLKLDAEIDAWKNQENNDPQEIKQAFESIKPKYENHQHKVENCNRNCLEMKRQLEGRRRAYDAMKDQVKRILNTEFRYIMRKQGHDGSLIVNYEDQELEMNVHMKSHDGSSQVLNTKTLSGGERSFTQVALIMALQKFSGSPMCIYDEFDVFMDSVNRGNSIRILLAAALGADTGHNNNNSNKNQTGTERQYIFITPNDVSPIIAEGHKNQISIHKLNAPRK